MSGNRGEIFNCDKYYIHICTHMRIGWPVLNWNCSILIHWEFLHSIRAKMKRHLRAYIFIYILHIDVHFLCLLLFHVAWNHSETFNWNECVTKWTQYTLMRADTHIHTPVKYSKIDVWLPYESEWLYSPFVGHNVFAWNLCSYIWIVLVCCEV